MWWPDEDSGTKSSSDEAARPSLEAGPGAKEEVLEAAWPCCEAEPWAVSELNDRQGITQQRRRDIGL
jgi:hypothetical protein